MIAKVFTRFDKDSPIEEALGYMREQGIPPIPTIKTIRNLSGMELRDAKFAFDNSDTWADAKPARDEFFDTIDEMLETTDLEKREQ